MLPPRTPFLVKKIYPGMTWDLNSDNNTVYLSFDDGPTPGVTEKVLDILKTYNIRATFFCIGRNAERYPDLFSRIISEGHSIGNHTYSHLNGFKTGNKDYYNDIQLAGTVTPSDLFRPPYGMIRPSQINYLRKRFKIIMWDIMSYDYDPETANEKCLSNVLTSLRPGAIVVFHDSVKASEKVLYALPKVLEFLKENKFTCSPIYPTRV
jgi:peptidoglycan/xylan/chitin deacetylase (PgdA/CDA1 family)